MNVALRKLALLEKNIMQKEEAAKVQGYTTSPVDPIFKEKIVKLMKRVRAI